MAITFSNAAPKGIDAIRWNWDLRRTEVLRLISMIPARTDDPIAEFTRFAREWFGLLARGAFADAVSRLDEPNTYGELWDAEKIQSVLQDYASSESIEVTDPDELDGDGNPDGGEFDDGRGYWLEHDVPLDGEWSDLTAQFQFLRRPGGYAVVLHDIHVL